MMRRALAMCIACAACGGGGGDTTPIDGTDPFDDWTFEPTVDDKPDSERGIGDGDDVCQPVTVDTVAVTFRVAFQPPPANIGAGAQIRYLVFEVDHDVADASADCVAGATEPIGDSLPEIAFALPADRPDLGYYIAIDADTDGNGSIEDACTDYFEGAPDYFEPAEGAVVDVILEPKRCD